MALKQTLGLKAATTDARTYLDVNNPGNKHYHKDAKTQMVDTIERFRNRAEIKKATQSIVRRDLIINKDYQRGILGVDGPQTSVAPQTGAQAGQPTQQRCSNVFRDMQKRNIETQVKFWQMVQRRRSGKL